ncbi:MAG: ABC transporter ATP-binding protein [Verrucomicrobiales bacterium]|nr:ABC transporter ATP-binding protein [Verrucomicrobiales bacterium]
MRIELRTVSKSYGRTRALDRVSCEIEPGQLVAVLGANGAGKSTLLRCLSTVIGADKGTILCDGQPLRRDRLDLRRRMLFLPDFPLVYGGYSVIRHLGMLFRVYEAETTGVEDRAVAVLRDLDLLPLANRPVATLSRGQAYKAALAGLLTLDPEVWLLDEPFASGMDPHGIQAFRDHATEAVRRGRTILYTTQILDVVERFADRVMVLHEGELRAWDTMAQLREQGRGETDPLEHIFRQLRSESV